MRRKPNQNKALTWFSKKYDLKPQLSTHPVYYFVDKSGKEVTHHILNIVSEWDRDRKATKPQRVT